MVLSSPDEEILDSVVVNDLGGCLAGDVEVDLAAGFAALGQRGSADPVGGEGLPEDLVILAVVGAGVEVGDDRGDGASNGLDGGVACQSLPASG
jgi:hypothetical protein